MKNRGIINALLSFICVLGILVFVSGCSELTIENNDTTKSTNQNNTSDIKNSGSTKESKETDKTSDDVTTTNVIRDDVTYDTYQSFWLNQFDYTVMPIAGYNSCPIKIDGVYSKSFTTKEHLLVLKECGLNTAYALYEILPSANSDVIDALNACDELGLAYVARMSGDFNQSNKLMITSSLSEITQYESFAGILVSDEPGYRMFKQLNKTIEAYKSVIPGFYYHTNIFPSYASERQCYRSGSDQTELPSEGYSYEQYVDDFLEIVNPQVLSYDSYPFKSNSSISNEYYNNLALIRNKAMNKGIPFWIFIQAYGAGDRRVPNEEDILWQVNTGLSFGCKGIQYFCYTQPDETFEGCLVDTDGNKTDLWYYAQRANKQIAYVDEVLMCSLSKGLIFTGIHPSNISGIDSIDSYGALTNVSALHTVTGCFDYDNKDAYYITNDSVTEDDNITLTFNAQVKGYYVIDAVKYEFDTNKLDIELTKGNGCLVVIE